VYLAGVDRRFRDRHCLQHQGDGYNVQANF
jgi:hypothetical protein